jgi:hypothetical protein
LKLPKLHMYVLRMLWNLPLHGYEAYRNSVTLVKSPVFCNFESTGASGIFVQTDAARQSGHGSGAIKSPSDEQFR